MWGGPLWCKHRLLINSARCGGLSVSTMVCGGFSMYPYSWLFICINPHSHLALLHICRFSPCQDYCPHTFSAQVLNVRCLLPVEGQHSAEEELGLAWQPLGQQWLGREGIFGLYTNVLGQHTMAPQVRPPTPHMQRVVLAVHCTVRWKIGVQQTNDPDVKAGVGGVEEEGRMGGSCHQSLIINQTEHYIALHCTSLHSIAPHCTTLHYIALHCNRLFWGWIELIRHIAKLSLLYIHCTSSHRHKTQRYVPSHRTETKLNQSAYHRTASRVSTVQLPSPLQFPIKPHRVQICTGPW